MNAARLPALVCGLAIVISALAHEAAAVEQAPVRTKTALLVATAVTPTSDPGLLHSAQSTALQEDEAVEDWSDPRRLLLSAAALLVFLAYRRRGDMD
jgi:hypothetical protein